MGSLIKNIIIVGGLIAVAAAGYYLVVLQRGAAIDTSNEFVTSRAEQETQSFLARLQDLQSIQLSAALFSDPRFKSFTDFTGEILQSPYGRTNPFGSN